MASTVQPFDVDQHLAGAVDALLRVRAADPTYPPARDAVATVEAFADWLLAEEALFRWVYVDTDAVRGFVQVTAPHAYLTDFLEAISYEPRADGFAEVGKLFVDPEAQGLGVGSTLLRAASAFAWTAELQPALAVVSTSTAALELYRRRGWRELGSFDGVHGENRVMVDEHRVD